MNSSLYRVPIDKLSVVITLALAFVVLHEPFTAKSLIGCIEARVEEHQKNLASYEKIKRFTLLPEPFMMGCELTDTLKLRRPVVLQKYATEIEAMYEE